MNWRMKAKWRRVIFWTLFAFVLLVVFYIRARWIWNFQQRTWANDLKSDSRASVTHRSPSASDPSVEDLTGGEVNKHLKDSSQEWNSLDHGKRVDALTSRVRELEGMEPEKLEKVVDHLLKISGEPKVVEKRVELSEIDLESSVPVNMREVINKEGKAGVIVEMLDSEGNLAELWVDQEDLSPEEQQALQAYRIMNRVPSLHTLRPLLVPLLRRHSSE